MWSRIAALAERQHGVAARAQLEAVGLSRDQVGRLRAARVLHPVHRGVYAVGHSRLTREGRWMGAVLAGGGGAVLSHQSAGIHWRLLAPFPSLPRITTRHKGRARPGIEHHTALLPSDEVTARNGIPITTVARTLLDLAAVLAPRNLERAIAEAEYRRYADATSLHELIRRHRGHRGLKALRTILGSRAQELGITRSVLEQRFLGFLDARRFERPELNASLQLGTGFVEVDCLWRRARVVAELDGRAAHMRVRKFESDRVRDRRLLAGRWTPVRITAEQLKSDPDGLEADLAAIGLDRDTVRP